MTDAEKVARLVEALRDARTCLVMEGYGHEEHNYSVMEMIERVLREVGQP